MALSSRKLPALDGLRGVALLCVLAAHAGLPVFGGSLIMFTLSGFLITSALLREQERTGTIAIRAFYLRRARRLLPALVVMLGTLNLVVPLIRPDMTARLPFDSLTALLSLANWTQAVDVHVSPLMHLWSLSVQEQVYGVWPWIVACLSRRTLLWTCVLLAVSVALLRMVLVLSGVPLATVYFMTVTRIDGVLLGGALAVAVPWLPRLSTPLVRWLSGACVIVLALCLCLYPLRSPLAYLVSMPIASLCTAVLIALCCLPQATFISRVLSSRVLVGLGTISYSVYLWHYPLIVLLIGLTPQAGVIGVIGGLAAGALSYRLIERPLLKRKTRLV